MIKKQSMGGFVAADAFWTVVGPVRGTTVAVSLERHGLSARPGWQSHSMPAGSVRAGSAPFAIAAWRLDKPLAGLDAAGLAGVLESMELAVAVPPHAAKVPTASSSVTSCLNMVVPPGRC
jgi:hypothetical protein